MQSRAGVLPHAQHEGIICLIYLKSVLSLLLMFRTWFVLVLQHGQMQTINRTVLFCGRRCFLADRTLVRVELLPWLSSVRLSVCL